MMRSGSWARATVRATSSKLRITGILKLSFIIRISVVGNLMLLRLWYAALRCAWRSKSFTLKVSEPDCCLRYLLATAELAQLSLKYGRVFTNVLPGEYAS